MPISTKTITILEPGISVIRDALRMCSISVPEDVYTIVPSEADKSEVDKHERKLSLNKDDYDRVITQLRQRLQGKEEEAYIKRDIEYYPIPKTDEQKVHNALKNESDILARAYDRRTNLSSWILQFVLKRIGFKLEKDNFSPVSQTLQNSEFVKVFTEYLKTKKHDGNAQANSYLENKLGNDPAKLKLAKMSARILGACNRIPHIVRNFLPVVFSLQNIAMPWLAKIFKDSKIGSFCNSMLIINPWVGDFFAELLGNFKHEIENVKELKLNQLGEASKESTQVENKPGNNANETIDEVKISQLTKEEYELQKIVKKVNDAFIRIFGKNTTLSSLVLNGILWVSSKGRENYPTFSAKYVDNPDFIKKLYNYLKSNKNSNSFEQIFGKETKEERFVANIILGAVRFAKSLSPNLIKHTSNIFGLPYSIQNLVMPILARFVQNGPLATVIHVLRDVNPIINDLFVDHIGNFRKEILDVQSATNVDLFPKLDFSKGISSGIEQAKSLFKSIRSFYGSSRAKLGLSQT